MSHRPAAALLFALVTLFLAGAAPAGSGAAPRIDGVIGEKEWAGSERHELAGGGEVLLLRRGDMIYLAVHGASTGLASLCVGNAKTVSILHSSAALGTAIYDRAGDGWQRQKNFEFVVRDSPRTGPPSDDVNQKHMQEWGWLSNPSHRGSPVREFAIRLTPERQFLGVAYVTTDGEGSVASWPRSMRDDCAALRLGQGWTEEAQKFEPQTWHRLSR